MRTVNIHEAKTQLSRLIDLVVKGESLAIAKAGKPLVKDTALAAPDAARVRRRTSAPTRWWRGTRDRSGGSRGAWR